MVPGSSRGVWLVDIVLLMGSQTPSAPSVSLERFYSLPKNYCLNVSVHWDTGVKVKHSKTKGPHGEEPWKQRAVKAA